MTVCQDCGRFIDSDQDPDCFIEQPNNEYLVRCDICRDAEETETPHDTQ